MVSPLSKSTRQAQVVLLSDSGISPVGNTFLDKPDCPTGAAKLAENSLRDLKRCAIAANWPLSRDMECHLLSILAPASLLLKPV